jgi:tRNA-dependent cyclodipeptide synthase
MTTMEINRNLQGKCSSIGYEIVHNKGTVVIGISPGNSYFKKETIYKLLDFCSNNFDQIKVSILPIEISYHTYKASGDSLEKAFMKVRKAIRHLINNTNNSINELKKIKNINIEFINCDLNNKFYLEQLNHIYELYNKKSEFYYDARQFSRKVIETKLKNDVSMAEAEDEAAHYLIKECAAFLTFPHILNSKCALIYHTEFPFFNKLVAGSYDGLIKDNIGFLVISNQV